MKFAVNYSPEAAALLDAGRIEVDLYKCPEWPDLVSDARQQRPVYIHFPLGAGRDNRMSLDEVERWMDETGTPFANTHLAPRGTEYGIAPGSTEIRHLDAMTERMLRDVEAMVAHFGAERVIVENAPMPDPLPYDIPVIPVEVIRRIVEETGCGLLLDLAHATLTCERTGLDICEYLSAMPTSHLCELHVTGVNLNREGQREDHLPLTDADWSLLDWALGQIRSGAWAQPWVLAFEYGGIGPLFEWRSDADVIAAQVPRLYALTHSIEELV